MMPISSSLCLILVAILATPPVKAALPFVNSTAVEADTVICVYQISGQYGVLPRVLYYATLVLGIVGRYREWLVIGALASALTYSGSAAIHMLALNANTKPVYDLDILGCWAILSTGCLAFVAMVHWSSTVKQSRAKVVLILWGILMGIGLVTGRALLLDHRQVQEPACRSTTGQLLEHPYQLLDPTFSCTYNCFGAHEIMREKNEQLAIPAKVLNSGYAAFGVLLVGPIMAAAYKAVSFDFHAHSPSELCRHWVMSKLMKNPNRHQRLTDHVYDAAATSWYGGYIILLRYMHRQPWCWLHFFHATVVYPWLAIELFLDILTPPMFIGNIILNELNLQGQQLPTNEQPYAVGQWSPMVSTLLVLMASALTRGLDVWEKRKKVDIPRENGPTLPTSQMENASQVGSKEEGQITGTVVPRMQHAETLRDMEAALDSSSRKNG